MPYVTEKSNIKTNFIYNKDNLIKLDSNIEDSIDLDINNPIDLQKIYYLIEDCQSIAAIEKYGDLLLN